MNDAPIQTNASPDSPKTEIDAKTRGMIRSWIPKNATPRDFEILARWMRDKLHIGKIGECRAMIKLANAEVV